MRTLITGGTGYVGAALRSRLRSSIEPVGGSRTATPGAVVTPDLGPDADWSRPLAGMEAVVHCAARVHQMKDDAADPLAVSRRVNTEGTLCLARQAAEVGVRRFVFLSTVKVHGETTPPGRPFRADDPLRPTDAYSTSKAEAEAGLNEIAQRTGLEVVILRPPMIYGPEPKANMLRLLRWAAKGVPLPFGRVQNQRSLIGVDNLASIVSAAITDPAAAGRTYLVSDQDDVSTPDLIRLLAAGLGTRANLWAVPVGLLRLAGTLTGKSAELDRLIGSLVVDSTPLNRDLGWKPVRSAAEGITDMARGSAAATSSGEDGRQSR